MLSAGGDHASRRGSEFTSISLRVELIPFWACSDWVAPEADHPRWRLQASSSGQSFTPDSILTPARGNSASQPPVSRPGAEATVTWVHISYQCHQLRLHCTSRHVAARNVTVAHDLFHRLCPLPISSHHIEGLEVDNSVLQGCTAIKIRLSDCHEA